MGTLIAQPNPRQLGTVVCFPRFLHESHGLCESLIARTRPCQCKPLLVQLLSSMEDLVCYSTLPNTVTTMIATITKVYGIDVYLKKQSC
jgi:hypothetical protein